MADWDRATEHIRDPVQFIVMRATSDDLGMKQEVASSIKDGRD